jgi:dihydrofolate reductase
MRQLVSSFFISLDGVVEAPQTWHFPYFDDEMGAVVGEAIAASDAFLLGRRTYEEWSAYWPDQDPAENPMAGVMNETPKHVVSTTLDSVDWQNAKLLEGDLAEALTALKAQPGKNIGMSGSATLVRSLLGLGLVDELRLLVHPLVVGSGARLFENGTVPVSLELVKSRTFATGVLDLTYRPVPA